MLPAVLTPFVLATGGTVATAAHGNPSGEGEGEGRGGEGRGVGGDGGKELRQRVVRFIYREYYGSERGKGNTRGSNTDIITNGAAPAETHSHTHAHAHILYIHNANRLEGKGELRPVGMVGMGQRKRCLTLRSCI